MKGRKPVWLKEDLHGRLKARGEAAGKPLIEAADELVLAGLDGRTGGLAVTEQEAHLIIEVLEAGRRRGDLSTLVSSTTANRLDSYLRGVVKRTEPRIFKTASGR